MKTQWLPHFTRDYYKAQSYLAMDSAIRAMSQLNTAITISLDNFLEKQTTVVSRIGLSENR